MNNEEKILSALETLAGGMTEINTRLDGMDKRLDGMDKRLDGIDTRLDNIEADIVIIKEEATITRGATDQLIECWVERFGENDIVQVVSFS